MTRCHRNREFNELRSLKRRLEKLQVVLKGNSPSKLPLGFRASRVKMLGAYDGGGTSVEDAISHCAA